MKIQCTKLDARHKFDGLMQFLNKRHTEYDNSPADIGSWHLDCNAGYGGCRIQEVVNAGYGVTLITDRMKPREFCLAIDVFYALNKAS